MNRIIFVPQYPAKLRYQEFWFTQFPDMFRHLGFKVVVLGDEIARALVCENDRGLFAPAQASMELETNQINEYMNMTIEADDVLFMADISYPGLFPHVMFHKKPLKTYGFCHATSLNYKDIFERNRDYKWPVEKSIISMCDKIFVGSNYHKQKLNIDPESKVIVTYLPFQPYPASFNHDMLFSGRPHNITSVARVNNQKVDWDIEDDIEKTFGKIFRPESKSWYEYYEHLANSKILLITSFEETFGYQVVDGILNGCVVLAPNRCSYPELIEKEYLYDSKDDLMKMIKTTLGFDDDMRQQLLCKEQMKNFFNTIMEEIKK